MKANEIDELFLLFNEIKFDNINKDYSEQVNYEPDNIMIPDDSESDWVYNFIIKY